MRRLRRGICLLLMLLAAACAVTPTPTQEGAPTPTATSDSQATATTPSLGTPPVASTDTTPGTLSVWLPPEFAPDVNNSAGRLLADQISLFESAHPGTAIEVRIKAAAGVGGLLNALVTTANAAPGVLPNVVALRRDDLVAAAAAGLVAPLDERVPAAVLDDHFPFAQAMARVNGAWVGMPFAADARVLVYLTSSYASPPLTWSDVTSGTLVLPGGEGTGLTVLSSYLAHGGTLTAENGQPQLDAAVLATVLQAFQALQTEGSLSVSTLDYTDPLMTWQAFRERRATLAITSATLYLAEYFRVQGSAAALPPTVGGSPLTLADGWCWAVVNTAPESQALAAEFIAWLTAPEQHAGWSEAAQVLPTRRATLAAWQSDRLVPLVSDVLSHAQLQPPASVLAVAGPAARQALADVLNGRATPFAAATVAAELVNQP